MSKRLADSQITRETFREDSDDSDNASANGPKLATDAVMRNRRIAKPRKKMASFGNTISKTSSDESSTANAFSFAKPTTNVNAGTPFKFGDSRANVNRTNTIPLPTSNNSDTNAKLKALNLQFNKRVTEIISNDPFVNLTSIFRKYEAYIKDIKSDQLPNGAASLASGFNQATKKQEHQDEDQGQQPKTPFSFTPKATINTSQKTTTTAAAATASDESESSEDEKEIKVEGPKFTISSKPTTEGSAFSFASKKKREVADSDSESEVEIKGPQFKFSGTVSSDVFKLKENAKVGSALSSNDSSKPAAKEQEKKPPAFSFSAPESAEKEEHSKSAVSFAPGAAKDAESKPSFSFSSTPVGAEEKNTTTKKPVFAFGATSENSAQKTKPSFSFGSSGANTQPQEGSKSAFGTSTDISTDKGNNKNGKAPSFTFGTGSTNSTEKPSFKFGATENKNGPAATPAFSFGSSTTASAPAFSFGKPADSSSKEQRSTSSNGFKFSLPFAQGGSTLDKDGSKDEKPDEGSTAKPSVEETNGEEQTQEPSQPMSMSNGEEDEDVLFAKRAKLLIFNSETKGYDSRGLGELKVLQRKDDKSKVRILCRSDGMGHILLNTSVVKSFQYVPLDSDKENFVKCPVVNSEGKLDTYIIRVKQKSDGRQLCTAISNVQSSM